MRRRDFLALAAGAAALLPISSRAQRKPIPRVGVLWHAGSAEEEDVYLSVVQKAFSDLGYVDGKTIVLYRHQAQAVAMAATGQSFVVTTGTGSGKSLCFFIPIIDAAVRARAAGEANRTAPHPRHHHLSD